MVGMDTGFFVGLMKGDSRPVEFWASLVDSDTLPVISMLTLGELLYISFRLGQPDKGKELVDSIDTSARVMPVDRPIVEKAASLKAGRGIPYIDSIILSTFMLSGCREIHTTDRKHFTEIKVLTTFEALRKILNFSTTKHTKKEGNELFRVFRSLSSYQ